MILIILWITLVLLYVFIGVFRLLGENSTQWVIFFAGLVALLGQTFATLQKNSLRFYFLTLRSWHWLRNSTARWWISIRYDGHFDFKTIESFRNNLCEMSQRFKTKIMGYSNAGINFVVNDTLNFYLELHTKQGTNLEYDFISLDLSPIEVGYNDSNAKLNKEIIPICENYNSFFNTDNQSYTLNIQFEKSNPFFAVYINHLKPEHIEDFQILLQVDDYAPTGRPDSITIDKKNIYITAQTVDALKELAKDFLLLSPNVRKLAK